MRLSGPVSFPSYDDATDGGEALVDAGYSVTVFTNVVDVNSSAVFGAVWCDIDEGLLAAEIAAEGLQDRRLDWGKLAITARIDKYGGWCGGFGEGDERNVWAAHTRAAS